MAQVNAGRVRFVGRGEYDNSTQYYIFDLVNYNGNSYFAKSNTLGNLPTNTTYWQLIAEKGNTGSVGPTGETGNGISSITKTSTSGLVDTYTITFTNGQTTTYEITNGANGSVVDVRVDGTSVVDNGIANIVGINEIKQELEDMYNLLPKVQGTGETITLDNTVAGKMLVDLKGNTSQETTTGKNLLNESTFEIGSIDAVTGQNVSNNLEFRTNGYIEVESGETYTLSNYNYTNYTYRGIFEYDSNKTYIKRTNDTVVSTSQGFSLALSSTTKYVRIRYIVGSTITTVPSNMKIQYEKGSTATSYEEYTGGIASPNPDYPQDIHVVSGDNSIDICGKNLFNKNNLIADKRLDGNGALINDNIYSTSYYINCFPNTTYSFNKLTNSNAVCTYDENKQFIRRLAFGNQEKITTRENEKYFRVCVYDNDLDTFMLERNDQATTYEAYKGASYPINLGSIELCKIGDYQDSIKKSTGKNLFENVVYKDNYIVASDGSETENALGCIWKKIKVKPNTIYTLSYTSTDYSFSQRVSEYNSSETFIQRNLTNQSPYTFTTTSTTEYINLSSLKTDTNIIINEGSTALPYEPYGIGWYLNKQIGKAVLNGSENWLYSLQANVRRFDTTITNAVKGSATNNPILSTHFKTEFALTNKRVFLSGSGNLISIIDNDFSNTNDFKNWLSSNNVTCYYGYTTPTYTEITDTTLISQLETVKRSFNGQTNITQTNDDKPFILDVTALKQLTE